MVKTEFQLNRELNMITTSEIAVTITIWALTAAGTFFGSRAVWRRRKQKRSGNDRVEIR